MDSPAKVTPTFKTKSSDKLVMYFLASSNNDDIEACKTVNRHLSQFIRNAKPTIEIYSDYAIEGGYETEKYQEKLYESDLVIIFGSSDFIADDEIDKRLRKLIPFYNKRETIILAILVRNFLWKEPLFGLMPILPRIKKPLYDLNIWSTDDAFATVAEELKELIVKHYGITTDASIEVATWEI